MEERQRHPMEALLLYVANKLAEQYHGRDEEKDFDFFIHAAEQYATKESERPSHHEQGKLTPAPEAAPAVDTGSLEHYRKE